MRAGGDDSWAEEALVAGRRWWLVLVAGAKGTGLSVGEILCGERSTTGNAGSRDSGRDGSGCGVAGGLCRGLLWTGNSAQCPDMPGGPLVTEPS